METAPVAADIKHQGRLARRQAEQCKAELIVAKDALRIRVQPPCIPQPSQSPDPNAAVSMSGTRGGGPG